jgi:competence protein ComEC
MIRRHFTPALVAFAVTLSALYLLPAPRWPLLGAAAAALASAGIVLFFTQSAAARRCGLFAMAAAAGLLLGAASLARMTSGVLGASLPARAEEITSFTVVLTDDSTLTQEGTTVVHGSLRAAASARHGVQGGARGGVAVFLDGDDRRSRGEVLTIGVPLAPSARLDERGQFTARARLHQVVAEGFSSPAWEWRAGIRHWLHGAVAAAGYPSSALMEALLVGSREEVPTSLHEAFRRTGSLHILALSGLHVTVIFGVFAGLLRFLKRPVLTFAIAAAVLAGYQFVAGFLPSLLRATIMILVGGAARFLDRDGEPLGLLSLSGILVLLGDPWQAYSLSFQLSYLALAGILLVGPLVQRPLEGRLPRFLLVPLAMSVGAQAATLPLVVAAFGAWFPSGLVAGLLLVPLTTALLWAGLAWLPLFAIPWPFLHDACARGFALLYTVIERCASFFALAPGIAVRPPTAPWIAGACSLLLLLAVALLPARTRGATGGAPA